MRIIKRYYYRGREVIISDSPKTNRLLVDVRVDDTGGDYLASWANCITLKDAIDWAEGYIDRHLEGLKALQNIPF